MTDWPLNWRDLVEEAARRRRSEDLTQAGLANLADVSRATVVSFERGDTNLQLEKVLSILAVLGMVAEVGPVDPQLLFVQAATRRWDELVSSLAEDDPARLTYGHVIHDYFLADPVARPLDHLLKILQDDIDRYSGWPPFWVPVKRGLRPYRRDGVLECWLGGEAERLFADAGHADFWRVAPDGRAFLLRGYQEDGADALQPGTFFDVTLPIWRTAELLLHAADLAASLSVGPQDGISYRARYTGLEGRELLSWAKPLERILLAGRNRARVSAVTVKVETTLAELDRDLEGVVGRALIPLYERFDGYQLPPDLVALVLADVRSNRRPG